MSREDSRQADSDVLARIERELEAQPKEGERSPMDFLRLLVRNADDISEAFNDRFSVEEHIKIHRAWRACGWDIYPDQWTPRQVAEALAEGRPPTWDENERPTYEHEGPELCAECGVPVHASESDDDGRCPECVGGDS